jgi:CheY-like chemotaxis protein
MEQKRATKADLLREIATLRSQLQKKGAEQEALQQQLAQALKIEAVGRLAGSIAHDFNNLLTTIIGYSELILSRMSKTDPFQTKIKEILKVGERAADLTKQLLEFNRQQTNQPQGAVQNSSNKEPRNAVRSGSETILLVEDEAEVRQLSRYLLKRLGYTVFEADGITKAIQICTEYSNPIHLMLTDIVLLGMNGIELYNNLREIHPEMKALYITSHSIEGISPHGLPTEETEFIQKPFNSDDLANRVRNALDRR